MYNNVLRIFRFEMDLSSSILDRESHFLAPSLPRENRDSDQNEDFCMNTVLSPFSSHRLQVVLAWVDHGGDGALSVLTFNKHLSDLVSL